MKKIFLILGMMLGGVGGAWGEQETPVTNFETRLPIDIIDCRSADICGVDETKKCYETTNCGRVCYCYPNPIIPDVDVCVPTTVMYSKFGTFINGCTMYTGVATICNNLGNAKRITTYACSMGCYVNWDAGDIPDCRECPGVGDQAASSITKSITVGTDVEWVNFSGIETCYLPQKNAPDDVVVIKYEDEDGTFEIVEDKVCMY